MFVGPDLWLAVSTDWDLSHNDQVNVSLDCITSHVPSEHTRPVFLTRLCQDELSATRINAGLTPRISRDRMN